MGRFPDKIDSKFRYVLVAASRAEQLMKGAAPKVEPDGRKATQVAVQELQEDLVAWEMGEPAGPEILEEDEAVAEEEEGEEPSEAN